MERLTPLLPAEAAARIRTLWEEYEACATPEARWVKALDKAETILQHNQGANPADFDYEFNLTYGAEWFRDDALLRRLRRLLDAETLYTRSRNDFTSACAAYRTSLARYMRVTGR